MSEFDASNRNCRIGNRYASSDAGARAAAADSTVSDERKLIEERQTRTHSSYDGTPEAAYRALSKVVSALLIRHGRVWAGHELIASLASDIACNHFASEEIGRIIEPWLIDAAQREGYTRPPVRSGRSS